MHSLLLWWWCVSLCFPNNCKKCERSYFCSPLREVLTHCSFGIEVFLIAFRVTLRSYARHMDASITGKYFRPVIVLLLLNELLVGALQERRSKFLSWVFGHLPKRLYKKDKVNFKFYDATAWLTNNLNTHIAQYFEK